MSIPRRAALALPALAMAGAARAQPAWPSRPVRLIVGFPAGSTPDIAARALAQHLQPVLGQPVVVDNRAGGGGTIGVDAALRAQDEHSLIVTIGGPGSIARLVNPLLPYDPATDLMPISLLARMPFVLSVNPGVPVRDVAGLIAHARANPGRLNYGSVGAGTLGHLVTAEFAARHGLEMTHVPFRSWPQAIGEVVAGRVQLVAAAAGAVLPQVLSEQVRPLAVTGEARMNQLPAIPTLREQNEPDIGAYAWIGLFAPRGTPEARITRLAGEAAAALAAPETHRALTTAGFEPLGTPPGPLATLVRDELSHWGEVIQRLGIRPES
ncbi:Bug family tripartite tricarboxylate transporter substrate binding protein [Roseococcus microcysteis]|uniref:Bug family tripartite tricarboxylate transporter substrate binding protein n=1 Tax=Roseococcus microcysteis TaxID=2771361 RepID=UPI00168A4DD5|nr:tripartite tricarboxylate transporter substrate binding protein [Roseococcus microcysteis]